VLIGPKERSSPVAPRPGACTCGAPQAHNLELVDFKELEVQET